MKRDFNYKMITLARESRGLTQKDLSVLVSNLNQGNLSKVERGQLSVTPEVIQSIAKALNYPTDFFYQESVKTPVSTFYYRKRSSAPKKILSKFESTVDIIRLSVDKLLCNVEMDDFVFPQIEVSIHNTPEDAAKATRNFLRIPKGPINNLVSILENKGIFVFFIEIEDSGIDGITVFTDSGRPIIFVNKSYSNDRKRLTIAHELGHLVMHIPFLLEEWRDEEKEAFQFASEFLMPVADCKPDFTKFSFSKIGDLKSYWGLSKAAIIRRAKEMNIITVETYKYMMIELGRRGERKQETGFVKIDEPGLLKEVLDLYLQESHYSSEQMAAELSLSTYDLEDLFLNPNVPKLRIANKNISKA